MANDPLEPVHRDQHRRGCNSQGIFQGHVALAQMHHGLGSNRTKLGTIESRHRRGPPHRLVSPRVENGDAPGLPPQTRHVRRAYLPNVCVTRTPVKTVESRSRAGSAAWARTRAAERRLGENAAAWRISRSEAEGLMTLRRVERSEFRPESCIAILVPGQHSTSDCPCSAWFLGVLPGFKQTWWMGCVSLHPTEPKEWGLGASAIRVSPGLV